ncbi:MAG: hypothetical protein AAGM38_18555 [Pseudomonadota bacterium]
MRLSFLELVAVLFAGLAGGASAVQAYVSWETRGEVSRAIVFAERIDACADVIAAMRPFAAKAGGPERQKIAASAAGGRYAPAILFYGHSTNTPGFRNAHEPRLERLRRAAAAASIVLPQDAAPLLASFETALARDIPSPEFLSQAEMLAFLERLGGEIATFTATCRGYLDAPPASAGAGLSWW